MQRHRVAHAIGLLAFAAGAAACAPVQKIALDCVPEEVTIYVDGRALEGSPQEIELRADRAHKIYVKVPGQAPQLLVLEPDVDDEGRQTLEPADVCIEVRAVGLDRELPIEVEEEPGPASP